MHTHINAYIHANAHTRVHVCMHARTHAYTRRSRVRACAYNFTTWYARTFMHACVCARACSLETAHRSSQGSSSSGSVAILVQALDLPTSRLLLSAIACRKSARRRRSALHACGCFYARARVRTRGCARVRVYECVCVSGLPRRWAKCDAPPAQEAERKYKLVDDRRSHTRVEDRTFFSQALVTDCPWNSKLSHTPRAAQRLIGRGRRPVCKINE